MEKQEWYGALATARRLNTVNNDSHVDRVIFLVSSLLCLCSCLLLLCWLRMGLEIFCIESVLSNNQSRYRFRYFFAPVQPSQKLYSFMSPFSKLCFMISQ